ncbi:hypothetical protein GHT06_015638 [Daphnia sinensis]|uniref:Uncharacterized protein n=1 Tax=Daphnia sinensis TaxID=1820382 RepID=A0AAD5KSR8_9CRUS|nr:hypothetical protein GHT06_015638 [Daphnia sinensis]
MFAASETRERKIECSLLYGVSSFLHVWRIVDVQQPHFCAVDSIVEPPTSISSINKFDLELCNRAELNPALRNGKAGCHLHVTLGSDRE